MLEITCSLAICFFIVGLNVLYWFDCTVSGSRMCSAGRSPSWYMLMQGDVVGRSVRMGLMWEAQIVYVCVLWLVVG